MGRHSRRLEPNRIAAAPLTTPSPRAGGCTFAEHPGQSCAQLLPLWSGLTDKRVLRARAKEARDHTDRLFDVSAGNARILIGADREHVLVKHGAATIRFDVIEGTVLKGPVTLHFDLADDARLDDRLAVIRTFRAAPTFDARHQRLANRLLALQATDLRDAGASLRETADHVFGPGDWPGDGDHRKSRVRRLCDIGRGLIEAGPGAVFNESAG